MSVFTSILKNYRILIHNISKEFGSIWGKGNPELCYAVNVLDNRINSPSKTKNPLSILERIIDNGFMWAVPKSRRSLERRMTRRMGFGKLLLPKKNLVVCDACGHFHPVHTVCEGKRLCQGKGQVSSALSNGNCYEQVKQETDLMQEAITKELKLDPIDKEVAIVYEDDPKDEKLFEGKRIVEMQKERPQWFSKNLLVKDSELRHKKPKTIGVAQLQPTVTNDK